MSRVSPFLDYIKTLIPKMDVTSTVCLSLMLIILGHFRHEIKQISLLQFLAKSFMATLPFARLFVWSLQETDNTYTLFDGLAYNTCGYFASCAVFFRAPQKLRMMWNDVSHRVKKTQYGHPTGCFYSSYGELDAFEALFLIRFGKKSVGCGTTV